MPDPFDHLAQRRSHLGGGNLLRSLTDVINKVEGGINLGQGICDLDTPLPLVEGARESIEKADAAGMCLEPSRAHSPSPPWGRGPG